MKKKREKKSQPKTLELEGATIVKPNGDGNSTVVVKTEGSKEIIVWDKDGIQKFQNTH